ncbi:MAG: undecaprenyl-diphosphate phosphatase [Pseudomonadota bacterium]
MDLLDIIALALIQGITEFLPISSSGHLALWPLLTGRPDQGPVMDVAVHLGTLVAVCLFFRSEVSRVFIGFFDVLRGRISTASAQMFWLLALATVPAVIFGLVLKFGGYQDDLRVLKVIGWATLIGGVLLWLADRVPVRRGAAEGWTIRDAVLMGLAQAVALIPGTSRSGITMTMARWLGFDRTQAARLALLMAMPVILAAGGLETVGVIRDGDFVLGADLILGAGLSCIAALMALAVMMRMFASEWTMLPFVIYRVALGVILLVLAYSGATTA